MRTCKRHADMAEEGFEPQITEVQSKRANHSATMPPRMIHKHCKKKKIECMQIEMHYCYMHIVKTEMSS